MKAVAYEEPLHMYEGHTGADAGIVFGHENMGIVQEVGPGVGKLKKGDRIVLPFNAACGFCRNCLANKTGPTLLEFITDPAVPPIPPHATLEQIENAALSVVKGDSDRSARRGRPRRARRPARTARPRPRRTAAGHGP